MTNFRHFLLENLKTHIDKQNKTLKRNIRVNQSISFPTIILLVLSLEVVGIFCNTLNIDVSSTGYIIYAFI